MTVYVYLFSEGVLLKPMAPGPNGAYPLLNDGMMGTPNKIFWLPFEQPLLVLVVFVEWLFGAVQTGYRDTGIPGYGGLGYNL